MNGLAGTILSDAAVIARMPIPHGLDREEAGALGLAGDQYTITGHQVVTIELPSDVNR